MYGTTFRKPSVHVQRNIFEKTFREVCSLHLCTSFGHLLRPNCLVIRNRRYFPSKPAICRYSSILQRLTVPRRIDQFGHKRCQKKRKDVGYELLSEFFFVSHERWAVKNSFIIYGCHEPNVLLWTVLYAPAKWLISVIIRP